MMMNLVVVVSIIIIQPIFEVCKPNVSKFAKCYGTVWRDSAELKPIDGVEVLCP